MQDAGACAVAFLLEAEGSVELGDVAGGFLVGGIVGVAGGFIGALVVVVVIVLIIPPWHDLNIQLSQPLPHHRARPIRLAE